MQQGESGALVPVLKALIAAGSTGVLVCLIAVRLYIRRLLAYLIVDIYVHIYLYVCVGLVTVATVKQRACSLRSSIPSPGCAFTTLVYERESIQQGGKGYYKYVNKTRAGLNEDLVSNAGVVEAIQTVKDQMLGGAAVPQLSKYANVCLVLPRPASALGLLTPFEHREQMQDAIALALVNEASMLLDSGLVERPEDIDLV